MIFQFYINVESGCGVVWCDFELQEVMIIDLCYLDGLSIVVEVLEVGLFNIGIFVLFCGIEVGIVIGMFLGLFFDCVMIILCISKCY